MRGFRTFDYRGASYRISPSEPQQLYNLISLKITAIREELEEYIKIQPEFLKSLTPVAPLKNAPEAAILMAEAAELTGIGPMSAVAGTTAQLAARRAAAELRNTAEAGVTAAVPEMIIENGGDIFILPGVKGSGNPVIAGIFSGIGSGFEDLALKIHPGAEGTAVCSSSSRMGHSLSFGDCDLCTVFSANAALADSAATLGGNLVRKNSDLGPAVEKISAIRGVSGVLIIRNKQIAMAGNVPELVRHSDPKRLDKITGTFFM